MHTFDKIAPTEGKRDRTCNRETLRKNQMNKNINFLVAGDGGPQKPGSYIFAEDHSLKQ